MKNKLLKIIFGVILFIAFYAIATTVQAVTIKENVSDYDNDIYLIGATRFNSNVVITIPRAAQAGMDQAKVNLALGKELAGLEITTYHYDSSLEEWYELRGEKLEPLTATEIEKVEANLDVFFVNNEEKKLEFPYVGQVKEDTITAGVTYDGAKFTVPATKFTFKFETEDGVQQTVLTNTTMVNNEKEVEYGDFYIPYMISVYDSIGGNKIGTAQTTKEGYIDETGLYSDKKARYKLCYTDEAGAVIDFTTKKVNDNSYSIYQKWVPEGELSIENGTYSNLNLTYNGDLYLNSSNKNEIKVKLHAPEGYDTTNTTIAGYEDDFNTLKADKEYVELPLIFTDKSEIKEIEVTWKEGVTTKFTVALGENARFQRKVEFWTSKLEHTELVFDGDTLTGPEKAPTGSKADQVFTDWSLDGKPYDLNTKVTANMRLEAIFKLAPIMTFASPLGEPKIGEELEITLPITPKDFVGKDITLDINIASAIATSTRTYTTIEYDENNYIKALVNGEWKDAKDIPIKLEESNQSVTFKIKITDKIAGNGVFYLCYDMKHNNEKIYTGLSSKKYLLTEDTAVVQGPMGYFKALSKITGKDGEFRLAKDTTLTSTLEFKSVNKRTITLDLNGHTLTGPNKTVATGKESLNDVIKVMYANDVTIKNSKNAGKIVANKSGAGVQIGTATGSGTHVTIEDGVEIESVVYGIGIAGKNTVLDFKGKITLTGTEGSGYAISGNGTNEEQYTIINIYPTAIIDAQNKNLAFYLPQMGELNILGGNITASTVIGVKSGKVNISGGTLTANGEAFNPALTGNGTITTGNVIYAEVNDSYAKNIEITITGGTLSSTNGNIIQVYKSNSTDNVTVNSSYTSEVDQNDTNIIRYN